MKNLLIETMLGIHDYEKKKKFYLVNLEIEFNSGKSEFSDNISHTLNYSTLEKGIVNLVFDKEYNLIEYLSRDILNYVLNYKQVENCKIQIEKKGCTKYSESIIIENYDTNKKMGEQVIIGLGSSIGNKKEILDGACDEIKLLGDNFRISTYLESEPYGGVAKNTFLNAVCVVDTEIEPFKLLEKLQNIENNFGRKRDIKWEDRTLDLDILYYGDKKINTEILTIPHLEIQKRDFVKNPILELFPDFKF